MRIKTHQILIRRKQQKNFGELHIAYTITDDKPHKKENNLKAKNNNKIYFYLQNSKDHSRGTSNSLSCKETALRGCPLEDLS